MNRSLLKKYHKQRFSFFRVMLMNRVLFVVLLLVSFLNGAAEDVEARTINIMESLNLATGDTISAQTMIDYIKVAGKEDTLNFEYLVIDGDFNFTDIGIDTVRCALSFFKVKFQGDVDFSGAQFRRNVNFKEAQFQSNAMFSYAQFQGESDFRETVFHSFANFTVTKFQSGAFGGAHFDSCAMFSYAQFQVSANFSRAYFWNIHFDRAQFIGGAYFEETQFQGIVDFREVIYNFININWAQLDGHIFYDRTNYSTFLGNFDRLNSTEDYDACYYDFRVQKRKNELKWYSLNRWWEYIFLDLTCGYGVKPFKAIYWAVIFMFLYSFIYIGKSAIELRVEWQKCYGVKENGESCNNNRVHGTEFCLQHQNKATWVRRFKNALIFSIGTFTTVGYGDWHPVGWRRYAAMIEGLVGWLIMALFLVTLGKVWIR